jgi:hypothetical protein
MPRFINTLTKQSASQSIFGNVKREQTVEKNSCVQFSMQTAVAVLGIILVGRASRAGEHSLGTDSADLGTCWHKGCVYMQSRGQNCSRPAGPGGASTFNVQRSSPDPGEVESTDFCMYVCMLERGRDILYLPSSYVFYLDVPSQAAYAFHSVDRVSAVW